METPMPEELLASLLEDAARKRFGPERAKALGPAIGEIARSLAAVEGHPLELEEEPAFGR